MGEEASGAATAGIEAKSAETSTRGEDEGEARGRKKASAEMSGGKSSSSSSSSSPPLVAMALAVAVLAVVLRSGWTNVLLVLFCSILLLLNPWVRTFLELPQLPGVKVSRPASSSRSSFSPFDPARFLATSLAAGAGDGQHDVAAEVVEEQKEKKKSSPVKAAPLERVQAYAALRRMPTRLRSPLADLEELIVRDFVCTWYEYHSFGDGCLPNEARYSIDHAMGSIYASMEYARTADVASELLLTATSVLLTTLRNRRLHPDSPPIFASDNARIAALREAIDRVFLRHMKSADGQCDMLRVLLREILSKQVWNALGGIGERELNF